MTQRDIEMPWDEELGMYIFPECKERLRRCLEANRSARELDVDNTTIINMKIADLKVIITET